MPVTFIATEAEWSAAAASGLSGDAVITANIPFMAAVDVLDVGAYTLDGLGHTLTLWDSQTDVEGLVRLAGGVVRNVRVNVNGATMPAGASSAATSSYLVTQYTAASGGNYCHGTVDGCHVQGTVTASFAGGIAAYNFGVGSGYPASRIMGCSVTAPGFGNNSCVDVVDLNRTGGICSRIDANTTVSHCACYGDVVGGTENTESGGICAVSVGGTITDCVMIGNVTGGHYNGGIVGSAAGGTIARCFVRGTVTADTFVSTDSNGGLIGQLYGSNFTTEIQDCFVDVTLGQTSCGYLVGYVGASHTSTFAACIVANANGAYDVAGSVTAGIPTPTVTLTGCVLGDALVARSHVSESGTVAYDGLGGVPTGFSADVWQAASSGSYPLLQTFRNYGSVAYDTDVFRTGLFDATAYVASTGTPTLAAYAFLDLTVGNSLGGITSSSTHAYGSYAYEVETPVAYSGGQDVALNIVLRLVETDVVVTVASSNDYVAAPTASTVTLNAANSYASTFTLATSGTAGSAYVTLTPDSTGLAYGMRPVRLTFASDGFTALVLPSGDLESGDTVEPPVSVTFTLSGRPYGTVTLSGTTGDASVVAWSPASVELTADNYSTGATMQLVSSRGARGPGAAAAAAAVARATTTAATVVIGSSDDPAFSSYTLALSALTTSAPCFAPWTLVFMPVSQRYRRVDALHPGHVVQDAQGRTHVVRRVTTARTRHLVTIRRDSIYVGTPSQDVTLTPNHLVRHPAYAKPVPAGRIGERVLAARPVPVVHVGFDDWTFLRIHNLDCETLAWRPEHHAQRPFYK